MSKQQPGVRDSLGKRLALIVFLSLPILIVALLLWAIAGSISQQASTLGSPTTGSPSTSSPEPASPD